MATVSAEKRKEHNRNRQIVGFSLPIDLARDVKAEAASRGISLRTLFEELWGLYSKSPKGKK